jgi:hypothetical protein
MRRLVFNCLLALIECAIVAHILRWASPVFEDGYGPEPSLYWGRAPFPGQAEYMARRSDYDVLYAVPYVVAAAIIAIIGWGVASAVARIAGSRSATFTWTAGVTFGSLVLASIAVDAGTRLRVWEGPLLIAHQNFHGHLVWFTVLLSASVLNGMFRLLHRGGAKASTLR